jgi:hypothetical protein
MLLLEPVEHQRGIETSATTHLAIHMCACVERKKLEDKKDDTQGLRKHVNIRSTCAIEVWSKDKH